MLGTKSHPEAVLPMQEEVPRFCGNTTLLYTGDLSMQVFWYGGVLDSKG